MEPVLTVLIVFGSIGLILWRWIESRHAERIAMIEKGVSPADFKGVPVREMLRANPLSSLKWGLLATFVGVGLIVANWLDRAYYFQDSIYVASMLVFGGLALILFYFVAAKKAKQE
jgi:hypothetical protein